MILHAVLFRCMTYDTVAVRVRGARIVGPLQNFDMGCESLSKCFVRVSTGREFPMGRYRRDSLTGNLLTAQ